MVERYSYTVQEDGAECFTNDVALNFANVIIADNKGSRY